MKKFHFEDLVSLLPQSIHVRESGDAMLCIRKIKNGKWVAGYGRRFKQLPYGEGNDMKEALMTLFGLLQNADVKEKYGYPDIAPRSTN